MRIFTKFLSLLMLFLLFQTTAFAVTYYSLTGATNPSLPSSWTVSTTGAAGTAPTSITNTDDYIILNGASMTLSSGTVNMRSLTINTGGTLTVAGGTLTVSIASSNASYLVINGTLIVSSGNLNVNGRFTLSSGTFNQSGGTITVDGNSGVTGTSITTADIVSLTPTATGGIPNLALTGGVFVIVDPSFTGTSTTYYTFKATISSPCTRNAIATGTHTFQFGDGVSTQAGQATYGFRIYTYPGTYYLIFNNVVNNGKAYTGTTANTNRWTYFSSSPINGDYTVKSGGDTRLFSAVAGNMIVEAGGFHSTSISSRFYSTTTAALPSPNTQLLDFQAGSIMRNNTTSTVSTVPMVSTLTIINNNATGITLNQPTTIGSLSYTSYTGTGSLTTYSGIINTNATNYLHIVGSAGTGVSAGHMSTTAGAAGCPAYAGGAGAYVKGPLYIRLPLSGTATSTEIRFAVGKGSKFLPFGLLNAVTAATGNVDIKVEAFDSNSGTSGTGLTNLAADAHWETSYVANGANLTAAKITLGDNTPASSAARRVASSPTVGSQYDLVGGNSPVVTTVNTAIYPLNIVTAGTATGSSAGIAPLSFAFADDAQPPSCPTTPSPAIAATAIQRNPTLTWVNGGGAVSYDVYLSTSQPSLSATPINVTVSSYTPSAALLANTTYYWTVVAKNANGAATGCTEWSFTTSNNIAYCTPTFNSFGCTDGDVIARVVLNTLDNNSGTGCPGGVAGYSSYVGTGGTNTTTLTAGTSYTCTVWAGQYSGNYAAWIDFNGNGTFETSERIGFTGAGTTAVAGSGSVGVLGSSANFTLAIPCNPTPGDYVMRIRNAFSLTGASIQPCGAANGTTASYGEVEDYTVTIAPPPPCPSPSTGVSSAITNNKAVLSWTTGCVETSWDVHVVAAGGGAPSGTASDPGVTKPFTKTGLLGLTNYEYWVRAVCTPGSLYSSWVGPFTFSTLADPPTCATALIPANMATNIAAPISTISWTAPTGPAVTSYVVYFGTVTNPDSIGTTTNTFVNITGLTVSTTYYWRIKPKNSGGAAAGCTEQSFTTAATTCDAPTALAVTNIGLTTADISFTSTGTNFILEYGPTGFVPGTAATAGAGTVVTGTASPIALTGLTASTNYQVYVRTDCGSGTISANSTVLAFSTGKVNDLCAGAIALPLVASDSITGWSGRTNLFPGATGVTGGLAAAACVTGGALQQQDVWYSFVAPSNVGTDMFVIENACLNAAAASVGSDWNIAIYDACGGSLVGCNEDSGTGNGGCSTLVGRVALCPGVLTAGTTYYVRTAPYSSTATAGAIFAFTKASTCLAPPANNDFASATDIQTNISAVGVACTPITAQTTVGATNQAAAGQSSCGTFDTYNDVWYKFNSGVSMLNLRMDVNSVQATKTVKYALYKVPTAGSLAGIAQHTQGGIPAGTGVCGSATSTTAGEAHFTGLEQNQNYYVRVWSTSAANAGAFDICFTDETPAPAAIVAINGATPLCATATTIVFNASNNMTWVPVMDGSSIVCMINANGNNMGSTTVKYYRNTSGTIRTAAANQVYGDRNFEVSPAVQPASGMPASVRIYMTQAEWDALALADPTITYTNFGITRVSGAISCSDAYSGNSTNTTLINGGIGTQNPFGVGSGVQLQYNTPGFSTFFVNNVASPLPIVLKSFTAFERGNVNVINWETDIEQNVRNYVIEKSSNGLSWTALGTVKPNASKRYGLTDNTPFITTYYRLKNEDTDGRSNYSTMVVVERQTGKFNITSVAPNPTSNDLTVKFETIDNVEVAINVLDIFGKVVLTQQVEAIKGINSTVVNTSNLPAGAYFLNVNNGVNTLTQRIVKQ